MRGAPAAKADRVDRLDELRPRAGGVRLRCTELTSSTEASVNRREQPAYTGCSLALVVGQPGIEPGASALSGPRSSRLSYWPEIAAARRPRRARPRGSGRVGPRGVVGSRIARMMP